MLLTSQDLAALLRRVADGDRDAFDRLYQATSAKLYGIILRILKRRDLADEILQEVCVKVWQRAGDFDASRASAITWLATIARNRALDEIRKAQPVQLNDESGALEVPDAAPLALEQLERNEAGQKLEDCLAALEDNRQAIVRLAYLDGCSRIELAERFGQPVNTIKTWLHRSLKQLRDCLGQ